MIPSAKPTRRCLLGVGLALGAPVAAWSNIAGPRRLVFEVWRGSHRIGRHSLDFNGDDKTFVVSINAAMAISLGPIPLFRYSHQATETWRGGRFLALTSHTVSNGRREQVSANRTPQGLVVETLAGARTLGSDTLPFTHWNQHALQGPLFNPQTGAQVRERLVSRQEGQSVRLANAQAVPATRYAMSGEAEIVDWYDTSGVWTALHGQVRDGSFIDYRRVI